jgi:hypothetical protein
MTATKLVIDSDNWIEGVVPLFSTDFCYYTTDSEMW